MAEINKAANTKRLARNTIYLYIRSFFCMLVSLYSSRLILQALGVDDYGVNNAVAGFASMFTIVTMSLSSAISRFLTFEQGTGNFERQKQIFSLSLNLMIFFSLIILLVSQTFGVWFVENKMTIPDGRETAALWAFRCAVLTTMTGLIVSPFDSAIMSHEEMGIYALISIMEAIMRLMMALYLAFGHPTMDRLILYTLIWTGITLSLNAFAIIYTILKYPECRFRLFFDKGLFKELFSYAGWNFVGSISGTFSGQGVNMLINIFHGPAVNAARGLSNTVQHAIGMLVNNFSIALSPQVTKSYASGDINYVKYLTYRGARFTFYIMFFFALPVLLESRFVFTTWLGEVPEHTIAFNRLALISSLIGLLYGTFGSVKHANGDIRNYKLLLSGITILQFPLVWIAFKIGMPPEIIYVTGIMISLACWVVNHYTVKPILNYTLKELFTEIYSAEIKVILCSSIVPLISVVVLPYGWWRFLITGTLCVLFTTPSILYLGCTKSERAYIYSTIRNKIQHR